MKFLIFVFSFLCASSAFAERVVMEGKATTGTSLFVSSTSQAVGIGTTNPANPLSVVGVGSFTGNVGIGTNSPKYQIDANGCGVSGGHNTDICAYNSAGSEVIIASVNAGGFAIYSGANNAVVRNWGLFANYNANGAFELVESPDQVSSPYASGTSRLLINSNGNVGIGTTNPSAALLQVNGKIQGSSVTVVGGNFILGDNGDWVGESVYTNIQMDNSANTITFNNNGSTPMTPAMRINSSGQVGIGTTNPGQALEVTGSVKLNNQTTGAVLCVTSGNILGHCTSGASCLTTCTCTCTAN